MVLGATGRQALFDWMRSTSSACSRVTLAAGAERSSAFRIPMQYTDAVMTVSRRYFAPGQLQFITSSVYRRWKLFESPRLRGVFVEVLRQLRREVGFLLIGWVLMTIRSREL